MTLEKKTPLLPLREREKERKRVLHRLIATRERIQRDRIDPN